MAKPATTTAPVAAVAVATRPAVYPETHVITLLAAANPKRGASAARFALYRSGLTVKEYLDGCALLHADEPRYRWRADLAWDVKRGFISVAAPVTE